MSQSNPFLITAVDTPRTLARNIDQALSADELKVLRQKLHAWQEAFRRRAEIETGTGREPMNEYISWQLSEYDRMLDKMNEYKNRDAVVAFVKDIKFGADEFGTDVAQKAEEFLRYWEEHARCLLYTSPSPRD